eukprot:jgi/Bigna1/60960/fgenesh1_kg.16_\
MWSLPLIWVAISIAIISSFVPLVQSEESWVKQVNHCQKEGGNSSRSDRLDHSDKLDKKSEIMRMEACSKINH